ncbi:MAG: glycosyltransferase [Deltaproteobacteria bacterium]|nr:glycosyltransferase [Deltaproteobacteria bacterium]
MKSTGEILETGPGALKTGRPLRILHLVGSLRLGGAERVVCTMAECSKRYPVIPHVMALSGGPLAHELKEAGIEPMVKPFRWSMLPFWLAATVRDLRNLRIDVIHTHLFTADLLGRISGRLAGVPVIVSTLHAPSTWKRSGRAKDRLKTIVDEWSANLLADGLIAISDEVRRHQIEIGGLAPSKIRVIGNPVWVEAFDGAGGKRVESKGFLGFTRDNVVITNIASLKPVKGQEYLLRCFSRLLKRHPLARLLLAGEGESRERLQALCKALEITRQVRFLGLHRDIPRVLSASDIFVNSSLSEGISIAILEAMGAGVPVVATAVGGNPDLIRHGETGLLVEPKDEDGLARALEFLILNPNEGSRMASAAFDFVKKNFDAPLIFERTLTFYRKLAGKKARVEGPESRTSPEEKGQ